MRILQVVHAYPPKGRTGVETHTRDLCAALAPRHTVSVLTFDPDTPRAAPFAVREERRPEGSVHWAPLPSRRPRRRREAALASHFAGLLARSRPEVVHFQHLMRFPKRLPELCREAGVPYVVSLHDYWWMCPAVNLVDHRGALCPGPAPRKCLRCIAGPPRARDLLRPRNFARREALHREVLHGAGRLVANSRWTADVHARHFGLAASAIEVIPEIVRLPRRAPRPRPPGGALRVGFLGRGSRVKGVGVLLEAIALARGDHRLSLHGGVAAELAEEVAAAERRHPDRVRDHGPYDHDALPGLLASLDVVVLPSIWHETYGIVLDEANAAGLPVIAARVGGIPEHVVEGKTGLLVPPGDARALADALDRLAGLPSAGLALDAALPDYDAHLARFEAIYASLAVPPPPGVASPLRPAGGSPGP